MRAIVTPDDLKKGELIPPGWYPVEIVDYDETEAGENAKNPGSTNCTYFFKVIDGPYKGYSLKRLFNETALGFGKALWSTLKFPYDPEKGYEISTDLLKSQIGNKLQIYVKRGKSSPEFGSKEFNDVQDFRPLEN